MTLTTTLRRVPAVCTRFQIDGRRRPAYLCGAFVDLATGEVSWVSWDARLLGQEKSDRIPVYVQSHALRQSRERLGFNPEHLNWHIIWQSLHDPRLIPWADHSFLVECRVLGRKVGYFVASLLEDKVLVKTFLLMTMQGTPEGEELSRRLRIGRIDIEYLGLDRLSMLVTTDFGSNPGIVGMLRGCGCGDIVDLSKVLRDAGTLERRSSHFQAYFGRTLDRCLTELPESLAIAHSPAIPWPRGTPSMVP